jgi:hypothetical protein
MSDSNLAIGSGDPLLHKTPDESKSSSEGASANMFMGVTLKGWAISAISAVAVLTSASTGFVTVFNKVHEENLSLSRTVRTVSSVTQAKLTEAQKHEQNNDHFEPIAIDSGSGGNSEVVSAPPTIRVMAASISRERRVRRSLGMFSTETIRMCGLSIHCVR